MNVSKNNRGRPRKNIKNQNSNIELQLNKRGRGRPKKECFDDYYENCECNIQNTSIIYVYRQIDGNLHNPINGDNY